MPTEGEPPSVEIFPDKCDLSHMHFVSRTLDSNGKPLSPSRRLTFTLCLPKDKKGEAKLDLLLQINPVGDTTAREIAAASQEVHSVLERLPGVERIEPQQVTAPDRAKGVLTDLLGGLALSAGPPVLKALLQTLQAILARQPSATKVLIQTKDRKISIEFDPKRTSLQELVTAAERLGAAAPPA